MSFVETLLAYLAKHVVASAAIGGLTIAGGAVVANQVTTDPVDEPSAEAPDLAIEDEDADDAADEATQAPDESTDGNGDATDDETTSDEGETDDPADEPADEDAGAPEHAADEAPRSANGRAEAVHEVIRGGELQPGDEGFGRAVAAAASEGRSEQRGRSGEAREGADDDAEARPAAPNEQAAAGQARAEERREAAQEKRQAAQEKREDAQTRRPAPGDDEADGTDAGEQPGPAQASARGRG
ncbi:hypothetical protein [Egicoccus sp. AB-alg2]|uniref:hypothetical protein n=1 Tax=Egicoccus sp. AB-alg2 TaxID=3242693 RepID=UPI00359E004A